MHTVNKQTVKPIIAGYLDKENVEAAFKALRGRREAMLDIFQVDTPDVHTNRMVNVWNPYQNMITFNLSRSASFFESGVGRGMGFRDSNQDLLGFLHTVPTRARERILDLAATQLETGGAYSFGLEHDAAAPRWFQGTVIGLISLILMFGAKNDKLVF